MIFFGKRAQQANDPFPAAWLAILHDNVLFYRMLTEAEQARMRQCVMVLATRKNWEGCAGQVITDEVKVTISGQAAMLLLGHEGYHFDELNSILVYPGSFLQVMEDELGHDQEVQMHLGEAMHDGPIALSWWHSLWAGKFLGSFNVVLHEFAHKLAELDDAERGRPPLLDRSLRKKWDRVMLEACEQLAEDDERGRPTLFDPYGAESVSEFFAVATETFFLRPREMRQRHRDVYDLLVACYRQDPAQREVPAEVEERARQAEAEYDRQAVLECTAALKQRPDLAEAYELRAEHRLALGDLQGALADWSEVIRRTRKAERAEALCARADVLRHAGRREEAIADYAEALRIVPDFELAYVARAELWQEMGQLDRVIDDLDRAIELCPDDERIYWQRAGVRLQRREFALALADCDRAGRLTAEDAGSLRIRAEALEGLGRSAEVNEVRERIATGE